MAENLSVRLRSLAVGSGFQLDRRMRDDGWSVPISPHPLGDEVESLNVLRSGEGTRDTDIHEFVALDPTGTEIAYALVSVDDEIAEAVITSLAGRDDIWERGVGTDTLRRLVEECVVTLGASHVRLQFPAGDHRFRRLVERCGFVHEGTLHLAAESESSSQSMLIFGILARKFLRLHMSTA